MSLPPGVTVEVVDLSAIQLDPTNPRTHDSRNLTTIQRSLEEVGPMRSVVVNAENQLLAGNGTRQAADAAGIARALVIETEGDLLIVHRRTGLTPDQQIRYKIADNVASDQSDWAGDRIAAIAAMEGHLLDGLISPDEQADLFNRIALPTIADLLDEDAAAGPVDASLAQLEALRAAWGTDLGQIWALPSQRKPGTVHRLVIGDTTTAGPWRALGLAPAQASCVFTSPPYNVARESHLAGRDKYVGDDTDSRGGDALNDGDYRALLDLLVTVGLHYAQFVFVNIQSVRGNKRVLLEWLYDHRAVYADTLIWDKMASQPAREPKVTNSQFEYVHVFSPTGTRAIGTRPFHGTVPNILPLSSRADKEPTTLHRATFPRAFAGWFLDHFTQVSEAVIDPFAGVGTTLVAAELADRIGYGIELDPGYAAVILANWAARFGPPVLLEEAVDE